MAGDWIKYRDELRSHPRFLALFSALTYNNRRTGMLRYICGDALGLDVMPPSNESVTDHALRLVTEPALRDVCLSALLRVWCAINAHCKVDGNDAVMSPMRPLDLDTIAGFEDFGDAMIEVGWVEWRSANILVFPNFLEYNQPARMRRVPLTNAERQARYRARNGGKTSAETSPSPTPSPKVTGVTKSNGEKSRVEKSIGGAQPQTDPDPGPPDDHPAGGRHKSRRSSFPKELTLSQPMVEYGASKGVTKDQAPILFEAFESYHRAKGSQFADWTAAWRTWVQKEIKFYPPEKPDPSTLGLQVWICTGNPQCPNRDHVHESPNLASMPADYRCPHLESAHG